MTSINELTPQQLRHAAQIQEKILELRSELSNVLGAETTGATHTLKRRPKMSADGLARIRAAQRKRWAKHSRNKDAAGSHKPKRKMSAAGRARIAAALKARWAAAKRAGRKAL